MYPALFSIGPLTIYSYGLFVAIGVLTGLMVVLYLGKAQGVPSQRIFDLSFILVLFAAIGSRAAFVILNLSFFIKHPLSIFKVWEGGLVFSGGIIAALIMLCLYIWRHKLSFWKTGDLLAPGVALGQGIGRIGCFMAGCCYGKPTEMIWGVVFTHPDSLAPLDIPLHPTQLYSVLSGFIIFSVITVLFYRKHFDGQVMIWFLILHSTARLIIERFRGDYRGLIPGTDMSATQLLSLIILLTAVIVLMVLKSYREKQGNSSG